MVGLLALATTVVGSTGKDELPLRRLDVPVLPGRTESTLTGRENLATRNTQSGKTLPKNILSSVPTPRTIRGLVELALRRSTFGPDRIDGE